MSSANETIYIETGEGENEPCWCLECGWDGVENDLAFTTDGIFVCPQCGGEEVDEFYGEDVESCVFCGSDKVVGVIDIVSLNEIHEATPLDKEQVYGYCARCADVKMAESRFDKLSGDIADEYEEKGMSPEEAEKIGDATAAKIGRAKYGTKKFDKMAEGSTGDQIISWEDGAGVSSPSMPPSDIFWSESKKERIASGRDMHYAIPSEKKYPIWDKAHARMALAWSQGTKYADKVEKAVTKRFPTMNAETVYRNYPGRKGPALSATSVKRGTRKRGNDGKMWEVRKSGRSQRWFRGAESFEALGEPDAPYDQGYDDQQDESIGERNVTTGEQSLKDRRDEADAMDKKMGRKYDDVSTMDSEHHKGQGYDDELDESLGMSHKESGMKQSLKDRRDESKGTEKFDHSRAYSRVAAMEGSRQRKARRQEVQRRMELGELQSQAKKLKEDIKDNLEEGDGWRSYDKFDDIYILTDDDVAMLEGSLPEEAKYLNLIDTISATSGGMNDFNLINMQDEVNWEKAIQRRLLGEQVDNEQPNYFRSENMGLTQYVGSAGGSGDGTPVNYGGIALPQSDVAAMVESSTENPMDASIGTVMGTMGAEEVPVVPDPSSFPQGDGRVLGQQTNQANLSPLHAENEDVQMVKIQDPVITGAKMALGVVALNATAIAGAALIGLAIAHTARREV
tara:strand:- start:4712 stop:6751 length:2040 start_codon:yes stop_codon:yes gene_type:complete